MQVMKFLISGREVPLLFNVGRWNDDREVANLVRSEWKWYVLFGCLFTQKASFLSKRDDILSCMQAKPIVTVTLPHFGDGFLKLIKYREAVPKMTIAFFDELVELNGDYGLKQSKGWTKDLLDRKSTLNKAAQEDKALRTFRS